MRFGFHTFMVDPAELQDIARAADACGWDSIQVADAPFFPEVISIPTPIHRMAPGFWPSIHRCWTLGGLRPWQR